MAYQFDGTGDYVVFDVPSAVGDVTTFSVAFWMIKDTFSGAYRDVIWLGGEYDANHNFLVQHDQSNYMVLDCNWSTSNGRWSIDVPDTNWHNYVITYDAGSTSNDPIWYKDGSSQTVTDRVTPSGTRTTTSRDKITLGANSDFYGPNGEYWLGKSGEFAIWDRVLTASEASIIGDGFSPLFIPNGLKFYAPLIRNTQDLIGGGVGAVTNAVVFNHPRVVYPWHIYTPRTSQASYINAELHRWRDDNGSETTASWLAGAGVNISRGIDLNTRLRFIMSASGNPNAAQFQLEYRKKGTADPWKRVV